MAEERRNLGLLEAGSVSSMAQQISQPTSTSSSRHLYQSNFQSRAIQTQAGAINSTIQMGTPSLPAYPVSYNRSSTNNSDHVSQTRSQMFQSTGQQIQALQGRTNFPARPTPISYGQPNIHFGNDSAPRLFQSTRAQTEGLQFTGAEGYPSRLYTFVYNQYPGTNFAGDIFLDPATLGWMVAIIQTDAASFMASQNQYQAPRNFSRQSSGAQTRASAQNFMAPQIGQGILTNSSRQYSVPGIAQEREFQIQAPIGTSNDAHTHPQMFQSTRAQTRANARNSMASQIGQGISTNSYRQNYFPGHGIAQERGFQVQAAVGHSNVTHSHPRMFDSTRTQSRASAQNSMGSQIEQAF